MITLRPYKDSDWLEIDDAVEPFTPLVPSDLFKDISKRSVGVTGIDNGKVMACGGIAFIDNDEGYVWVKVSEKCLEKGTKWLKVIVDVYKMMVESVEQITISSYVLSDFHKGDRLARLIGLERTGDSEMYEGNTYYKYTVN